LLLRISLARADTHERLILEVTPAAARLIDARATERLVVLETADVEVPAPPGASFYPPLYFRILPLSQTSVRVELWELGQFYGARSVSSASTGSLNARRIALAAAELARRLRQRRLSELEAANNTTSSDAGGDQRGAGIPIYARFAWSAGAHAAAIGGSHAWLVGPEIVTTLRFSSGERLSLGAAWLAGNASELENDAMRWLDVNLAFAKGFSLTRAVELDVGVAASVASVRVDRSAPNEPFDTWSSRGTAFVRFDQRLGRMWGLAFAPEIGAVLKPVSTGEPSRLGGIWFGAALSLSVDPWAP
jgi:hypothetical protein